MANIKTVLVLDLMIVTFSDLCCAAHKQISPGGSNEKKQYKGEIG